MTRSITFPAVRVDIPRGVEVTLLDFPPSDNDSGVRREDSAPTRPPFRGRGFLLDFLSRLFNIDVVSYIGFPFCEYLE
jgi:hypothetical protein